MATYHYSVSIIKRSAGMSAVAAAAYRSCSKIKDEHNGIIHDYTKKQSFGYGEILTPIPATGDNAWLVERDKLWNRVEAGEKRYDARLAREVNVAIPTELSRDSQIELVREYVQANYVDRGMVADICFHDLDSHNPHAHIMLTMRELVVDADGIADFGRKKINKEKYYKDDPAYQSWDGKDLLIEQRRNWETLANQYLAKAGHDVKIDCRSLEDQEIERIPQIHLGAKVNAMRKRGIRTERGDQYFLIDLANGEREAKQRKKREAERTKTFSESDEEYLTALVNANREAERISQLEIITEIESKPQSPSPLRSRPQPKTNRGRGR